MTEIGKRIIRACAGIAAGSAGLTISICQCRNGHHFRISRRKGIVTRAKNTVVAIDITGIIAGCGHNHNTRVDTANTDNTNA